MTITIQDFVQREIIMCVSTLVWELTQKQGCLDEEVAIELWTGPIDYEGAKYELEQDGERTFQMICLNDGQLYWGVKSKHSVWKIDPIHNDEETAIYEWFEIYRGGSLDEYRQEIFEHWIVSSWLADKLEALGETVVEDFYSLTVWARPTTGQAIYMDWPLQKIYQDLISK